MTTDDNTTPTAETRYNARLSTAAAGALMAWERAYMDLTKAIGTTPAFSTLAASMRDLRRCL